MSERSRADGCLAVATMLASPSLAIAGALEEGVLAIVLLSPECLQPRIVRWIRCQ